jgi:hypothetical protein
MTGRSSARCAPCARRRGRRGSTSTGSSSSGVRSSPAWRSRSSAYNYLRFGTPFENGYALIPGLLQEDQYRNGFFSVLNIPRKLYALFLTTPVEVAGFPWIQPRQLGGLSILLTTPLFLWAIKARRPDWFGLGAWAAVILTLIPILMHADPGGAQFGFRYAQDFYPFLFLLTVRGLGGRISFEAWVAIAIGAVVNIWGMGATYFDWWQ